MKKIGLLITLIFVSVYIKVPQIIKHKASLKVVNKKFKKLSL